MLQNGVFGTGISAHKRANDLSDFQAELDMVEQLGVASIELPTYDMDLVVGGRIRRPQLEALKRACAGRAVAYSAHGPLAINFMDDPWRLPRHFEVLEASMEIAAEVGARHYVVHDGMARAEQPDGIEAAYDRQRTWLSRAGDLARDMGLLLCVETLFEFTPRTKVSTPARLAAELEAIGHPNVAATLDFSHSYIKLDREGRRSDFVAEVAALAPWSRHLHVHDSFGRQDDIWMYTDGERLAYGHGDLHLPVGWGDIPWSDLMAACTFPDGVVFNIELEKRYWYAAQECVHAVQRLAESARVRR
jgi:sugar phosphate isomerase/epimerase